MREKKRSIFRWINQETVRTSDLYWLILSMRPGKLPGKKLFEKGPVRKGVITDRKRDRLTAPKKPKLWRKVGGATPERLWFHVVSNRSRYVGSLNPKEV